MTELLYDGDSMCCMSKSPSTSRPLLRHWGGDREGKLGRRPNLVTTERIPSIVYSKSTPLISKPLHHSPTTPQTSHDGDTECDPWAFSSVIGEGREGKLGHRPNPVTTEKIPSIACGKNARLRPQTLHITPPTTSQALQDGDTGYPVHGHLSIAGASFQRAGGKGQTDSVPITYFRR